MNKLRHIVITAILLSSCFLRSGNTAGNINPDLPFRVFINMDKLIFDDNEPVILEITVKNTSNSRKSFKIFDAEYSNFRPVVYDMSGKEAVSIVEYRKKNKKLS
jgi:hypothetical protein